MKKRLHPLSLILSLTLILCLKSSEEFNLSWVQNSGYLELTKTFPSNDQRASKCISQKDFTDAFEASSVFREINSNSQLPYRFPFHEIELEEDEKEQITNSTNPNSTELLFKSKSLYKLPIFSNLPLGLPDIPPEFFM